MLSPSPLPTDNASDDEFFFGNATCHEDMTADLIKRISVFFVELRFQEIKSIYRRSGYLPVPTCVGGLGREVSMACQVYRYFGFLLSSCISGLSSGVFALVLPIDVFIRLRCPSSFLCGTGGGSLHDI